MGVFDQFNQSASQSSGQTGYTSDTVNKDQPPDQSGSGSSSSSSNPNASSYPQPLGVPFMQYKRDARGNIIFTKDKNGNATPVLEPWTVTTTPLQNTMAASGQLVHGGSYQVQQPPRYFTGDEWRPGNLPPGQISQLQGWLVKAGFLDKSKVHNGVWDQASANGYAALLGNANAMGVDQGTALTNAIVQAKAHPPSTDLPIQLTSDDDLKTAFRSAFVKELGLGPTNDEMNNMVGAYHMVETQAQQQAGRVKDAGIGTVTAPPSPSSFAEQQAIQNNPTGVQKHELTGSGGLMDTFMSTLAKWGPNG